VLHFGALFAVRLTILLHREAVFAL
jgi:hypothetical protein